MRRQPGDQIVRREVWHGRPVGAWGGTVVQDDDDVLVLRARVAAELDAGSRWWDKTWAAWEERIEDLDDALPADTFRRLPLPWPAAFLAGKCFLAYRRAGGDRRSPLPHFYIGAHAAVAGMALLTRDAARYTTYLPKLRLIAPD